MREDKLFLYQLYPFLVFIPFNKNVSIICPWPGSFIDFLSARKGRRQGVASSPSWGHSLTRVRLHPRDHTHYACGYRQWDPAEGGWNSGCSRASAHCVDMFSFPFFQVVLPLIDQYFKNHRLYFLSAASRPLCSGGQASNKEKEMVTR